MRYGYIASIVFFALFWASVFWVPGGRGEACMVVNIIAALATAMLTYLTPSKRDY